MMITDNPIHWLTDKNTFFLFGAGCSKCAKKPLMSELTKIVISKISSSKLTKFFGSLENEFHDPNIEDLLNSLLNLHKLTSSTKNEKFAGWGKNEIEKYITKIKSLIIKSIKPDWKASKNHSKFLERISKIDKPNPTDIYSLNYDLVIEASLEELGLTYEDGFMGAENAHFDPEIYNQAQNLLFRLYKLHGSVNWIRDNNNYVRRRPEESISQDSSRSVIYPSEQKYIETKFGIYEVMINQFKERIKENRENNKLIILGYSFGDKHINFAIEDSVINSRGNISVFAFIGKSGLNANTKKVLKEMAEKCKGKVNFFIGTEEYIGSSFSKPEAKSIFSKYKDLSIFENIVKLIT